MIVPGGGLAPDGSDWVPCRPNFFLSVRVLSRLFRRLLLEGLVKLHRRGRLRFFGDHAGLADPAAFAAWATPLRKIDWVVIVPEARLRHDAKEPFAGPKAVLAFATGLGPVAAIRGSPVALYAPCRHLEQPPDPRRCGPRDLPRQELSRRGAQATHDHDAGHS